MACGTANTPLGSLPKYAHNDLRCRSIADPLNVIFENQAPAKQLGRRLRTIVNGDTGQLWSGVRWGMLPTANDQWIDSDGSCKMQDDQCISGPLYDRFHVRMWNHGAHVIVGAHHENLLTLGGNLPFVHPHRPDAYESGKDSLCDDFRASKTVVQNGIRMSNYKRVPYCSGRAALIR